MKKINLILSTVASLLAFLPVANGQTIEETIGHLVFPKKDNHYSVEENVAYSKQISKPTSDGTYWIKLETFTTGSATTEITPADIVLVLDVSSSMRNNYVQYNYDTTPYIPNHNGRNYWMYGDAGTNTAYYIYYEEAYHKVEQGRVDHGQGANPRYHYYMSFRSKGVTYYCMGDQIVALDAPPENVSSNSTRDYPNNVIYTGALIRRTGGVSGQRRIDALRTAVKGFIDAIEINDKYEDAAGTRERTNGRIGNRISMITFAGNGYITLVNSLEEGALADASGSTPSTATRLKGYVDAFPENQSGTRPDLGIAMANQQLATITRESFKTVVVFTDGEPYPNTVSNTHPYGQGYDNAIAAALTTKTTYDANVFSVGLFSDVPWEPDNLWTFMNLMSSNAPNASNMSTPGADYDKNAGYYKDASAEGADLSAIFLDIAHQSGGSSNTELTAATSNVDIISSSFKLSGDNPSTDDIHVFTAKCKTANLDTNEFTFYDEVLATNSEDEFDVYDEYGYWIESKDVDDDIAIDPDGLAQNTITVTGFDYSNNWCGLKDGEAHGHKIIIMIPIQMNPDAVGGPNVATNAEGSGIYVAGKEDPVIEFTPPTVSLPVNMFIEKEGLEGRESAKFKIERAEIPNVEVGEEWSLDDIDPDSWEYVSTVFVTNMTNNPNAKFSDDGNPMVKVRGLPSTVEKVTDENEIDEETGEPVIDEETGEPVKKKIQVGLVYRITEEPWSWSYKTDPDPAESQYTVTGKVNNPFTFKNKNRKDENIDVKIRHAESKVTNIFKNVENKMVYDDSKTNDRTSGSTSGASEEGTTD